jgi:hypothetical protein
MLGVLALTCVGSWVAQAERQKRAVVVRRRGELERQVGSGAVGARHGAASCVRATRAASLRGALQLVEPGTWLTGAVVGARNARSARPSPAAHAAHEAHVALPGGCSHGRPGRHAGAAGGAGAARRRGSGSGRGSWDGGARGRRSRERTARQRCGRVRRHAPRAAVGGQRSALALFHAARHATGGRG